MDIRHLVSADHANIRQIADQIRRSAGNGGPTGRDSLFDQFDDELRRHMMLMETVVMPATTSGSGASRDPQTTHHDLMHRLDGLGSGDRSGAEWTNRFEAFTDELDRVFGEHMQMVSSIDDDRLARDYGHAKLKALRHGTRGAGGGWMLGLGLGIAAAAVATTIWRRSQRRGMGVHVAGDIESTRRRLRQRPPMVRSASAQVPATAIS